MNLNVFDRLLNFRSADAPVLSIYMAVPAGSGRREMRSWLLALMKGACELAESEGLDHRSRQSLRSDIGRVLELETRGVDYGGHAVAVFACGGAGLYEEIVLPRHVRDRAVVDTAPYLRPLLAILDESRRYCTVVVDRARSWVYEFFMGELQGATTVADPGPRGRERTLERAPGDGRVDHRPELAAHRLFRETADVADEVVRSTGAELLVVGGHEETVAAFLPFLPQNLRSQLAGTFVIDPRTMTPGLARACAEQIMDEYERSEEERLIREALERVATGGLGAAGLAWCLDAVNQEAVQLLLVDEGAEVQGSACDNCGWLGLDGRACPVCGGNTRPAPDVIDEMAAAVIGASGRVDHVRPPTALSEHLVAAFLRFPVPRSPAAAAAVRRR